MKKIAAFFCTLFIWQGLLYGQVSIVVSSGDTLIVEGSGKILVDGNWVNNGVFVAGNGTVELNGSGDQTITNTDGAFNNLFVNKSAGNLQLLDSINVADTLQLTNGDLDLNGKVADLGTSGILRETSGNTVKGDSGYIVATRTLNNPMSEDVAGLGAMITSSANLGDTEVRRGHAVQSGNSNTGISRYYDIFPANNSNLDATLMIHYDDSELNSLTEGKLSLYSSADSGANWSHEAGALDTISNTITQTGFETLHRWTAADSAAPLVPIKVLVNAKLFLEGPFASDTMNSYLGDNALLPLEQPYNIAPWNYSGDEKVTVIPDSIVDWILVEVRHAADSTLVVATRAGFLKSNGMVTDLDGSSGIRFDLPEGNYYLALRHRNHLAVMTASSIVVTESSAPYDFTDAQSKAFGSDAMADMGNGVYAMRSGDGNSDGGVDALDRNLVWRPDNGSPWSYDKKSDFNLDGGIDALDRNLYWRVNNGTATQVPAGIVILAVGGGGKGGQSAELEKQLLEDARLLEKALQEAARNIDDREVAKSADKQGAWESQSPHKSRNEK